MLQVLLCSVQCLLLTWGRAVTDRFASTAPSQRDFPSVTLSAHEIAQECTRLSNFLHILRQLGAQRMLSSNIVEWREKSGEQ